MESPPPFLTPVPPLPKEFLDLAWDRLNQLTKPVGSLGRLEPWVARFAAIRGALKPALERKAVLIFAADHGITEEGVSAYPKDVTWQMVLNFLNGGAAINAFARHAQADVTVVDVGVDHTFQPHPALKINKVVHGTRNFLKGKALTLSQAVESLNIGHRLAQELAQRGCDLLALGDMGIGNTTTATAMLSVLGKTPPAEIVGRGTGVDDLALKRKVKVIEQALEFHGLNPDSPLEILAAVGGVEIGAMAGAMLGAASSRLPVMVDGLIAQTAAILALSFQPSVNDYLFPAHRSAEPGCRIFFDRMEEEPLLDLEMRLGEGTGAVLAMNLLEAGVKAYNEMATFQNAGVSGKDN